MGKSKLNELRKKAEESGNVDDWLALGDYAADRFIVGVAEQALKVVVEARPDDIRGLLLLGKALNRRRLLTEAETIYKRVLEIDPTNVEGNTGLAVVHGNAGRLSESIEYYEKAYAHDKAYPWCIHSYCSSLESTPRKSEAFEIAMKASEINPESSLIWSVLAGQAKNRGDTSLVQKSLSEALKRLSKDKPENQRRALMNIRNVDPQKTIEYGEKLLKDDPDHVSLHQILSMSYMGKNPTRGLDLLNQALAIDPTNPQLRGGKAALCVVTGNIPEALKIKEEMEKDTPEDFFSSIIATAASQKDPMSRLATTEGREEYLENARRMAQRFPTSVHAHTMVISGLGLCGRIDEAINELKNVSHLSLETAADYLALASSYQTFGLHEQADHYFEKALKLENNPKARFIKKGLASSMKHDYVTLEQDAYLELERDPSSIEAHAVLARLMHADDQYESAEKHAQIAAKAGIHDSMVLLASILKRNGNPQGSDMWLRRVIDDPKVANTIKGRAYLGLGDQLKAREAMKKALSKYPGDPVALRFLLALAGRDGNREEAIGVARMLVGVEEDALRSETDQERLEIIDGFVEDAMSGKTLTELGPQMMAALLRSMAPDLYEDHYEE